MLASAKANTGCVLGALGELGGDSFIVPLILFILLNGTERRVEHIVSRERERLHDQCFNLAQLFISLRRVLLRLELRNGNDVSNMSLAS